MRHQGRAHCQKRRRRSSSTRGMSGPPVERRLSQQRQCSAVASSHEAQRSTLVDKGQNGEWRRAALTRTHD